MHSKTAEKTAGERTASAMIEGAEIASCTKVEWVTSVQQAGEREERYLYNVIIVHRTIQSELEGDEYMHRRGS